MPTRRKHKLKQSDLDLLGEVKQRIVELVPGAKVFLYGSVARGEATPDSDYDLLVITPRKLTTDEEDEVYDAVYEVDLDRGVVVSVMFCSEEEWSAPLVKGSPFQKNVARESIPI